jgi:EmrB/QacA subfamily drug resistance transporter
MRASDDVTTPGGDGHGKWSDTYGIDPDVYAHRWRTLAILCLSLVMIVVAVSSVNVALPSIQESLDASGSDLQWIVDIYALIFAGLLLPAGALGDRFGRRGALQLGLVIFGLAAAFASMADDPGQLIAARGVMGVGAAFIMPSTLSILVQCFPFYERPKAIAVWAGFAGVGGAIGLISSGLLLDNFWWGSIFFVNLPIIAALLVLSVVFLPTSKDPAAHPLDPVGALLAVVALLSLVYGVIEGPERGWVDPVTLGAFALAVVAGVAFVVFELRQKTPMLDPRLFRVRGFSTGAATVTLAFFSLFGMFFLLTQLLQLVQGLSPLETGLRIIPQALTLILVAPQSPKLVARFGVRKVLRAGFLLAAVGFTILATVTADSSDLVVMGALVFTGAGMAMVMPSASQHIVGSLPLSKAGVGSAMNDVTREVGGAIGIAVAGSIVATIYRADSFADQIPDPGVREVVRQSVGQAVGVARRGLEEGIITSSQAQQLVSEAGSAFNDGTHVAFAILAGVAAISGLVLSRLIPDEVPTRQPGEAAPDVAPVEPVAQP